jgi:hypothetical protein
MRAIKFIIKQISHYNCHTIITANLVLIYFIMYLGAKLYLKNTAHVILVTIFSDYHIINKYYDYV